MSATAEGLPLLLTPGHHDPDIDRVLQTVLFTDIVGSTEWAAQLGDRRWRDLLDAHDAAVRRALERYRGVEVKATGDGFLAAFDGPARAIRCAQTIIEDARLLGLAVRTGLHTGECEVRGEDLTGIAVHTGARVAALARCRRGAGHEHRARPGRRLGDRVHRPGPPCAQGCSR